MEITDAIMFYLAEYMTLIQTVEKEDFKQLFKQLKRRMENVLHFVST